jgi:hypothetical protein
MHRIGDRVGIREGLDPLEKKKFSFPCLPEIELLCPSRTSHKIGSAPTALLCAGLSNKRVSSHAV